MPQMNELQSSIRKELLKREIASRSLEHYTLYTKDDYEMIAYQWDPENRIHAKIINALERVESWQCKRLMIFIRPRVWKSELASIRFPTWCLWRDPHREMVIASYSATLANDFGRTAKHVVEQPEFCNVFPSFKLSKDKKEWGNWETAQEWGLYTVWVQWSLTWRGYDIWIIDDPVKDRQEAESPVVQQRIIDWYKSTFYTRKKDENSAIVIMMTRWNKNDLAWHLLDEAKAWGDQWEVLEIPAIDAQWNEIIWPWKWSEWHTYHEKENVSPKDWAALYQQDPIASSSNIMNLSDLRYFLLSSFERAEWILQKEDVRCKIYIDPAFSSSQASDDAVILAVGKHKITNNYYQIDGYADTSAPSKTFMAALAMYDRVTLDWFKVEEFVIEDVKLNRDQTKFINDFKTFLREKDRYIPVRWYIPKMKKEDRIKFTLEPKISLNSVYIRKDHPDKSFIKRLESQIVDFPNGKHDDIIDCLTMATEDLDVRRGSATLNTQPKVFHNKITWKIEVVRQTQKNTFWLQQR